MLKNIVKLEIMLADKIYQFLCDNDSPLEHIKEALFQCQKLIGQIEDNIKSQLEAKKAQENQEAAQEPIVEDKNV
jgi:hypothetical protein